MSPIARKPMAMRLMTIKPMAMRHAQSTRKPSIMRLITRKPTQGSHSTRKTGNSKRKASQLGEDREFDKKHEKTGETSFWGNK